MDYEPEVMERTRAPNPPKKKEGKSGKYDTLAQDITQAVLDGLKKTKRKRRKKNEPNPRRKTASRRHKRNEPGRSRRRHNPRPRMNWGGTLGEVGGIALGAVGGHIGATFAINTLSARVPALTGKTWLLTAPLGLVLTLIPKAPPFVKAIGKGCIAAAFMEALVPMLSNMIGGGGMSEGELPVIQGQDGKAYVPLTVDESGEIIPMTMGDYIEVQNSGAAQDIAYAELVGYSPDGLPILDLSDYVEEESLPTTL